MIHMCLVIDVPSDDVRRASNLICVENWETPHTQRRGVTSIIYCRMAWSTSKLNTRKYNNISLIPARSRRRS